MDLRKVIKSGDRVVIKTPQGQTRKGKAVMYNPQYNSWVLNMGGAHGTPGIASEKNIVSVNGKPLPQEEGVEPVQEFGEKIIGYKYNVFYKDDPDEKQLKKMQVRAKDFRSATDKGVGFGGKRFVYRVELAEGGFKLQESDLPTGVRVTPLATQRRWEDLTDKAMKKWSWAKDKIEKMWYNHDLFMGVEKDTDGSVDLIWNYPLAGPVGISYAVKISARDFDAILKDPVRWLIERFGVEKAHGYLQRVKSKSFWESGVIRKIFSSVKKEVAEANGVEFTNEATYSYNNIKKDPKGWYQEPGMLGHRWAKETLESIERIVNKYGSSDWQKYIISNCFNFDIKGQDTWHVFTNHFSKKYLAHIQFVLRNGGKMSALQLLWWRSQKSGYLKDELDWALEYAAYKHDPEKYTEWYSRTMGFYGLPKDEAAHRLKKYIEQKIAPKLVNKNLA
jgi:hypothetical protein